MSSSDKPTLDGLLNKTKLPPGWQVLMMGDMRSAVRRLTGDAAPPAPPTPTMHDTLMTEGAGNSVLVELPPAAQGKKAPAAARKLMPSQEQAQRLRRTGYAIIFGATVPIALWMAFAPLSMAVVAPAHVKVDLNRRPVQHLEGGIVREVLVRDGQRVRAGEPLLRLGDVAVDAELSRLRYRLNVERAAVARLDAEQAMADAVAFPQTLKDAAQDDPRVMQALKKELALFTARRRMLDNESALLRKQQGRMGSEMASMRAEIQQAQTSLDLQRRDLERSHGLLKDGFISQTRVSQVEATVADYASRLEERRSEVARAQQRELDNQLKLKSSQNTYLQQASDQWKTTASRVSELEQELRKSEDAAARQVVAAPADGEVIDLRFSSPGAVVRAGEPIAEIVPSSAPLTIEAQVRPEEVSHVYRGQRARIKLMAFRYRSAAMVTGAVTHVSGDRLIDKASGQPYYHVLISADASSLLQGGDDMKLQAGMPAEVYIEGSVQTPLQYIVEPIGSTLRRSARQM
jgi:membrane fusion protein, epimerase transport system